MAVTAAEMQVLITAKNQADATLKQVATSITNVDKAAKAPAASLKDLGDHLSNLAGAPFKAVGGLTDALGKLGLAAIGVKGLADAALGLASGLSTPIKAASDLNESINKMQVVFGPSSKAVEDFAATSATALGQSKQQAIEATATFGNLFTSLGLGKKPAADMSVAVVKLASDIASFNNISPEEALEKLRSGLVGEVEPLRTVGVAINEAAVQTEAMRLHLVDADGEISEAAKVQARYSLILQQTKNAQGDFANTSTGMANATRIINAEFQDLQANIGARFYPTITSLVSQFAQALPGAINAVNPLLDRLAEGFTNAVQEARTIITTAQNISREFGVSGLQGVLIAVEDRIGEVFGDRAAQSFHDLLETAQNVMSAMSNLRDALAPVVRSFAEWASGGLPVAADLIAQLSDKLPGLIDDFRNNARAVDLFKDALIAVIALKAAAEITSIVQAVRLLPAALNPGVLGLGLFIAAIAIFVKNNKELVDTWVAQTLEAAKEAAAAYASGFDKLGTFFAQLPPLVLKTANEVIAALATLRDGVRAQAAAIGADLVAGFTAGISQGANPLVAAAARIGAQAIAALRESIDSHSPSREAEQVGIDFVEGFAQGIDTDDPAIQAAQDLGEGVTEAVTSAIDDAAQTVPDIMDQLAAALGTAVPRALTPVEKEVADFNDRIASETTKFNRKMADLQDQLAESSKSTNQKIEDENLRHSRKLADIAADRASAKTPAALRAANAAVQDENTRHQRALEDIDRKGGEDQEKARQAVLDKIEQLETDHNRRVEDLQSEHSDNMVDAEQEMGRRRGQAISDFVSQFDDLNAEVTRRSSQIAQDAARDTQNAIDDARNAIADAVQNAKDAINDLENNQILERAIRARRASFSGTQDTASLTRQRAQDDLDLQKKQADDLQKFNDDAAKQASDLAQQRAREDADAEYNLSRDLSRAKTADDAAQIQQRFDDQKADRDRSRRLDDAERADRLKDSKSELDKRQALERQALLNRRAQEDADRQFRQQQEQALQAFNDTLDDEALNRQIGRIIEERDQRIDSINDALQKKEQAIRDNEARERDILNQSYSDKLADLKANFFDKLGPLTEEQAAIVSAFLDTIAGKAGSVSALISKITTPAPAAQPAPAKGSGAPASGGGSSTAANNVNPSTPSSIVIQAPGGGTANVDVDAINSGKIRLFEEGGVVPGPKGAKQLAWVHGGEAVFNPEQLAALGANLQGGSAGGGAVIMLDGVVAGRLLTRYVTTSQDRFARIRVP